MKNTNFLTIILIIFLTLSTSQTSLSDDVETGHYPPMAAYNVDGSLWLYGFDDEPFPITEPTSDYWSMIWHPRGQLHDLVWSPNGRYFAFIAANDSIQIFDTSNQSLLQPNVIHTSIIPIIFDESSSNLLFAEVGELFQEADFDKIYRVEVSRISLESDAVPEKLVTVGSVNSFYGGGPMSPTEAIYRGETDGHWNFGDRLLVETPYGLLSSSGIESEIRLHNATETVGLGTSPVTNAIISPLKTHIATIRNENIVIINLANEEEIVLETDLPPDTLAWGNNDSIYFTSIVPESVLQNELSAEEQELLLEEHSDILDMGILTLNSVTINRVDILNGSEDVLYETDAYAIGRLMPAPDDSVLFFTTVPNMDMWLKNVLHDTIECSEYDCLVQKDLLPSLHRMDLATGEIEIIASGILKATINFPVYMEDR